MPELGPRQMQERYGLHNFITETGKTWTDKLSRNAKLHPTRPIEIVSTEGVKL